MMIPTQIRWKNVRRSLARLMGNPTANRQTKPRRTPPRLGALERLEARELMAVLDSTNGRLTVQGTTGADNIRLTMTSGMIGVIKNGLVDPIVNGSSTSSSVSASLVRRIIINGGLGNDHLDASAVSIPTTLNGDAGNDILYGSNVADSITGGDGNDRLFGLGGNDWMSGGIGNDGMIGGLGNDVLVGGVGNDSLSGESGDDLLRGDAGDDLLLGGTGTDNFDGGAGDFDRTDAVFGEITRNLENALTGPRLVVGGALGTDIRQTAKPYCVFYSHLSGMASILNGRGRNLANERIEFKGRDASQNAIYEVSLFSSSGSPVTHLVKHNGPIADDATPVDGEAWVTIMEKAFMAQIHSEDPTGVLWRRYWDHQTVMMILNGSSESVNILSNIEATLGMTLSDVHLNEIALALHLGKLVTASTWTTPLRVRSTSLVITEHNYTVVSVNRTSRTITLRNPWGFDMDDRGTAVGDATDGLITLTWSDFKGSFQGYNVGVVA